jgi:hypothetical protein
MYVRPFADLRTIFTHGIINYIIIIKANALIIKANGFQRFSQILVEKNAFFSFSYSYKWT